MSRAPLMPKATAVWLVENTGLSFRQIADFCHLHELEVKGIADGEVARDIRGADPIANGQLSREEIDAAQGDPKRRMTALKSRHAEHLKPAKKSLPDGRNAHLIQRPAEWWKKKLAKRWRIVKELATDGKEEKHIGHVFVVEAKR